MAHVRPSFRSGLPLLLSWLLLAAATTAHAAPEASPEPPPRKERIDALWLDAGGGSGWVRTVPMYIDDQEAEYRFGSAFCGRSHRLGEATLRALQAALASGQPVRIDAAPAPGDATQRCITGVAFFAS